MALITGTPSGQIELQDDIYIEGAPQVYFQDREGVDELHHPDDDGFYYGLSGTVSNPVYSLGCYQDVTFSDNIEVNAVRCDNIGDVSVLQKRGHLELSFTLLSLFPLSTLRHIIRGGAITETAGIEKMGFGEIDNARRYYVYFPKVYEEENADWLCVTGHKCQFVDAWEISMTFATPWTLGVTIWMLADVDMPVAQRFATMIRRDPSALP